MGVVHFTDASFNVFPLGKASSANLNTAVHLSLHSSHHNYFFLCKVALQRDFFSIHFS